MESSTNLHHHHHHQLQQDQPPTHDPSPPSFHGAAVAGTNHSWTPYITLNAGGGNLNRSVQEGNHTRSRSAALTDNNNTNNDIVIGVPPLSGSMIQDLLGYHHHHQHWTSTTSESDAPQSCLTTNNQSTHHHHHFDLLQQHQHQHQHFSKNSIKEETNLPKFTSEILNIASGMEAYGLVTTTTTTTTHMTDEHHEDDDNMNAADLNEKLLLKTLFSSGDLMYSSTSAQDYNNPHNNFVGTAGVLPSRSGNFSQIIYPSINISNLNNHQPTSNSTTSLESLDLLTSSSSATTFSTAGLGHHSQDLARFANTLSFRLDDHMQQQQQHPIDRSPCSTNSSNPSHLSNGTAEAAKRPCTSSMESSKASQSQTASKKSRSSESRPSCPPFKVRKEKLGDRIAALQQLVAPFGKTDTASVLMEAIGYIKFLQNQVETLSVPYMKSSSQKQTKRSSVMQGCLQGSAIGDANGEAKQDLRSRGLCLVPLSCMSYIAGDGGTEVWQHPNFGGAT